MTDSSLKIMALRREREKLIRVSFPNSRLLYLGGLRLLTNVKDCAPHRAAPFS